MFRSFRSDPCFYPGLYVNYPGKILHGGKIESKRFQLNDEDDNVSGQKSYNDFYIYERHNKNTEDENTYKRKMMLASRMILMNNHHIIWKNEKSCDQEIGITFYPYESTSQYERIKRTTPTHNHN